jgi:periplasmic protein TonB
MKTEVLDSRNLDDLIFENRNKDYGAYYIRKSYSKNMMTGLGFSVSIACLLVVLPQVMAMFGEELTVPPIKETFGREIIVGPPPTVQQPIQPTPPPSAPKRSANTNVVPLVTTKPVIDDIKPNNESTIPPNDGPTTGTGSENPPLSGTGGGEPGPGISEPVIADPPILNIAEVMPEYEGGTKEMMKFIVRNTHFPSSARRLGTQGTVFVSFVVDSEGNVVDVKVVKGISAECDKEAARVISKMRGWKAGMQNHRAVSVRMTLPIKFQLQEI